MKYCEKCGAQLSDEMQQCPYCEPKTEPVTDTVIENNAQANLQDETLIKLEKPKKKWLPIVAALMLLVVAAVAVWFSFLRADEVKEQEADQFSAKAAIDESISQLRALTADSKNIHAVINAVVDELKKGAATISVSANLDNELLSDLMLKVHTVKDSGIISGNLLLGLAKDGNEATLDINLALSDKIVQFSAPALLDDVLQLEASKEQLGDELELDDITKVTSSEEYIRVMKALKDSVEAGEPIEETILFGQEERDCDVYPITFDEEIAQQFAQLLDDLETDEITAADLVLFRLVVFDGKVVGLIVESEQESVGEIRLLLCGEENPWSEVSLSVGGEEKLTVVTEVTATGFEVELTDMENASQTNFICDDTQQVLRIVKRDTGEEAELHYRLDGATAVVSIEGELMDQPMTISIAPLEKEPQMLSENGIDITNLDQNSLTMLLLEALANIKKDPQTAWLYDLLVDGQGLGVF